MNFLILSILLTFSVLSIVNSAEINSSEISTTCEKLQNIICAEKSFIHGRFNGNCFLEKVKLINDQCEIDLSCENSKVDTDVDVSKTQVELFIRNAYIFCSSGLYHDIPLTRPDFFNALSDKSHCFKLKLLEIDSTSPLLGDFDEKSIDAGQRDVCKKVLKEFDDGIVILSRDITRSYFQKLGIYECTLPAIASHAESYNYRLALADEEKFSVEIRTAEFAKTKQAKIAVVESVMACLLKKIKNQ